MSYNTAAYTYLLYGKLTLGRPSSQDEDNAFRDAGVPVTQGTEWLKSIELPWSATDVVHLSLSNENDVYIVVRPELTASSREHKIPVIHLYLGELAADRLGADQATMDILNVVSRVCVELFPGFAPTNLNTGL